MKQAASNRKHRASAQQAEAKQATTSGQCYARAARARAIAEEKPVCGRLPARLNGRTTGAGRVTWKFSSEDPQFSCTKAATRGAWRQRPGRWRHWGPESASQSMPNVAPPRDKPEEEGESEGSTKASAIPQMAFAEEKPVCGRLPARLNGRTTGTGRTWLQASPGRATVRLRDARQPRAPRGHADRAPRAPASQCQT